MSMHCKICIAIFASTIITLLIRVLPVLFLAKKQLPKPIYDLLLFIPTSIMSTIVVAEVLCSSCKQIWGVPISLPTAILSFLIGYPARSLFITIVVSIIAYLALENINVVGSFITNIMHK